MPHSNELALLLDEPMAAFTVDRELTAEDVASLRRAPKGAAQHAGASPLVRIRHTHHQLARLIADGHKLVECSAITGYSQSRISILQGDPAFRELVAHYGEQKEAIYCDVHQRLANVGTLALEELQERLEERPEQMSDKTLREIMESTFDRSIAPSKGAAKGGASNGPAVTVQVQFVEPQRGPVIEATATTIEHESD